MDVVGIRLGVTPRTRHCDPAGLLLDVGVSCVVDTDQGLQFGTVVTPILGNPFYTGQIRWGTEVRPNRHQGIVSKKLFAKVQRVRAERSAMSPRSKTPVTRPDPLASCAAR